MTTIIVDFETYSPVDLTVHGAVNYLSHPDAAIDIMCYKEYPNGETQHWLPGTETPAIFDSIDTIYAHNALFDYRVWHMLSPFRSIALRNWRDSMALCGRFSIPQSLDKAGVALKLDIKKNPRGRYLMSKIACPTADGRRPEIGRDYTFEEFEEYKEYCRDDIRATECLLQALPQDSLSDNEQDLWVLTQEMNMRGLPVDIESVKAIARYVEVYIEEQMVILPEITNGMVSKPTQVKRIKDWCETVGFPIENTTAETVENLINQDDLPSNVRTVLELRQELGKSSTAKLKKIMELEHEKVVHDNLRYFGAGPGRWSGQGFQVHNLPRATIKNVEETIQQFKDIGEIENPVHAAKALIRGMIKAPEGKSLIVSDYSAIECVLLHWLAEDEDTMHLIRNGGSQYVDMAASLYKIPYDEIYYGHEAKDKYYSGLRQMGKVIILGCGYGMGHVKFAATAKSQFKLTVSANEARDAVYSYRKKYFKVKQMWNSYAVMCKQAVQYPGTAFMANGCVFKVNKEKKLLMITLPSKRSIFYMNPRVGEGMYGEVVVHDGTDPVTKQWGPKELIPGRITENIVQGLARDVMALGMQNVIREMPEVDLIGTVHDEAIGLIDDEWINDFTQTRFNDLLCSVTMDNWTETIPLTAEGYIAKRYKK